MAIYMWREPVPRTFTISWEEKSDMSSGWTYSDDAAGLTAGDTAFDEFFGYSAVRLSNAGTETAEVTQSSPGTLDITQLGTLTSGDNVMIKFPVRGIKMTKSGITVTLSITEALNKTGYQYYAHTKDNEIKDNLYIGTYKISTGYKSLSGAGVISSTRRNYRSGIRNTYNSSAGTDRYSQVTFYPRWYIGALYMMKYGNPNSQSVVGKGYWNSGTYNNTGGTDSQTSATYGDPSATTQIKLFGLENWWGHKNEFIDGCRFDNSTHLTVDKTNSVFQDSDYLTDLGTASSGWLAGIEGSNDGMFMNINTSGGSSTAYYTDRATSAASNIIFAGGSNISYPEGTGVFSISATSASSSGNTYSSRLQYL